jgi:hypothetical protein
LRSILDNNILVNECPNSECLQFKKKIEKPNIEQQNVNVSYEIAEDLYNLKISEGDKCDKCGNYRCIYRDSNMKLYKFCPCKK